MNCCGVCMKTIRKAYTCDDLLEHVQVLFYLVAIRFANRDLVISNNNLIPHDVVDMCQIYTKQFMDLDEGF